MFLMKWLKLQRSRLLTNSLFVLERVQDALRSTVIDVMRVKSAFKTSGLTPRTIYAFQVSGDWNRQSVRLEQLRHDRLRLIEANR